MNNKLSKTFTFPSLLKFTCPTMIMMIFFSLYTIVDGIFVSRYVGTDALSAINIVYPIINLIIAIAIMFATGGSAIIARKMGMKKTKEANEDFSLIVVTCIILGTIITVVGLVWINPIIHLLGADNDLFGYCRSYLKILLVFSNFCILQMLFQTFFVTAGRPELGLWLTVFSGIINAILDYVFIALFQMGIEGAAWATIIGQAIPAIFGLFFFARKNNLLHFVRPKFSFNVLKYSCFNGSSEMVTNLSTAVTTLLFNLFMMKYVGKDGVAAITIVLYAQFLFISLYLGFSGGVAPVISFNYGSRNTIQLKHLYRMCLTFIISSSLIIFILSLLTASPIVAVFSPKNTYTYEIAVRGFYLFSISFLFTGINIFASSMFTAFSDGKTSAIISFLRTFLFIVLGITILPLFLKIDGIWLAIPFAETATLLISCFFLRKKKQIYQYA